MKTMAIGCGLSVCLFALSLSAQEVSCESITGKATVTQTGGEVQCLSGSGIGWSSGSAGEPDVGADPLPEEKPMTLEELTALCNETLNTECGTEIPVPEEICAPDHLAACTDFVVHFEKLEAACMDVWDGDDTVSSDGGDATEPAELPPTSGILPRALADAVNPWKIADCCNAFTDTSTRDDGGDATDPGAPEPMPMPEPREITTAAMTFADWWSDTVNCVLSISADDCDALMNDCGLYAYATSDGDIALESSDRAGSADKNADEDDAADTVSTSDSDSSSCSIAPASFFSAAGTLLRILFSF